MELDYINQRIGKRIKDLRNLNGLTQEELANRTELTKGFISQLERGQVSPSVITLLDLIECLGISPSEFFEQEEEQIVFSDENYFEKIDENGNIIEWIIPTAQGKEMEPLLVEIKPHQCLAEDKPHHGEEFGYCLSGKLFLYIGDRKYTVKAGDSFYYEAKKKHRIENPGNKPAKLLWVSTPPSF